MKTFHQVQALRGIAASLVVIDHSLLGLVKYGSVPPQYEYLFWHLGEMGVCIFFIISGFIMTRSLPDLQVGGLDAAWLFLKKRFLRVVPIYWLATFVAAVLLFAIGKPQSLENLFLSLAFVPYGSDIGSSMRPILGQGWTLNYEMFFYVIFAFSLLFDRRISFALISLALLGFSVVSVFVGPDGIRGTLGFYVNTIVVLFLFGILIGIFFDRLAPIAKFRRPLFVVGLLIFADFLLFANVSVGVFNLGLVGFTYLIAAFCVIVCVAAPEGNSGFGTRLSEALGNASYSTYLFHTFLLAFLNRVIDPNGWAGGLAYVFLGLFLSNLLGYIIFLRLERPLNLLLRRRFVN